MMTRLPQQPDSCPTPMQRLVRYLMLGSLTLLATPNAEAEEPAGQKVFVASHCDSCHTVASAGITQGTATASDDAAEPADGAAADEKPIDLSDVGNKHTKEFLDAFLLKKEKVDGKLHRKRFRGTPEERATLVDWLCTLKVEPKK